MATRRVKYVLYLDKEQVEALRKISKRTRIPASVIARQDITALIKKFRQKGT